MKNSEDIPFSVVIPLYNKAPHIAETVQSVLNQTYSNFKLIIVNDASTDDSRDIVGTFDDDRIKIIERSTPGPGGYAARNRGIEESINDYIAFLDADDTWKENFLKEMVAAIKKYPSSGFYSSGWVVKTDEADQKLNSYARKRAETGVHKITLSEFLKSYIKGAGPVCSSAVVVKKSAIQKANGFPENKCKFGGDIDTWFRIMLSGNSLTINPVPLATYNREAVNMVTKSHHFSITETCVKKTARNIDYDSLDISKRLVKQFVNYFQYLQIRKKAMSATLLPNDLQYVYRTENKLTYLVFRIYALLPKKMQQLIVTGYNSIKENYK